MAITKDSPSVRLDLTREEFQELRGHLTLEGMTVAAFFTEHAVKYLRRRKNKDGLSVGESEQE